MHTFSKIVKRSKEYQVECSSTEERRWILQSLVNVVLNYRISGNLGMYNHFMDIV